ncbi:hypothetical protein ACFLYE_04980, partial [Chloroflexota bacterium]
LTVSDWVTFLSSEKYGILGTALNIGAFFLAVLAIILATEPNPVARLIPVVIFGVYVFCFLFWRLVPIQTRGRLAEKTLDKIMRGELKEVSTIHEEWTNGLSVLKQRRLIWKPWHRNASNNSTQGGSTAMNNDEYQKATNAYHAAIDLWKLASDQIYSRFTAMLTANSIILAVIGLSITERIGIPSWFVWVLIGSGIALCLVWIFLMAHGVRVENYYRKKAETLESGVVPEGERIAISVDNPQYKGFLQASTTVVYIFTLIYIAVLVLFATIGQSSAGS